MTSPSSRPLSPHLSVYRFHLSMALSIFHRIAGVAVAGMLALFVCYIWAAAYSDACFTAMQSFLASLPGQVMLVAASAVFYFKFASGLRHLWWDTGRGFSIPSLDASARLIIAFTLVATALTWAIVWEIL